MRATITVDADISSAPTSIGRMNPTGASTPAASGTEMMGLVILGGVEGELADDFAGCGVDDVDVQVLD